MAISRMKAQLLGGITAAVIGGLGAFAHWRALATDIRQLSALHQKVNEAVSANRSARALVPNLNGVEQPKPNAIVRLPSDANLGGMLDSLNTVLTDLGVVPEELVTHTTVSNKRYRRLPVSLRFRGNFIQVYEVLKRLRAVERLTRVDKLTIEDDADASASKDASPTKVEIEFSAFAGTVEEPSSWPSKQ